MTCPVMKSVRIFVYLRSMTSRMLMANAIRSTIIIIENERPMCSTLICAAACPKYGSMTAAERSKRSFSPASTGRKFPTSPLDATIRIM